MTRTTADWQALLDGATELAPAPWESFEHESFIRDCDNEPVIGYEVSCTTSEELALIASAPEAVAEVIRLREELEGLQEEMSSITGAVILASDVEKRIRQILRGSND